MGATKVTVEQQEDLGVLAKAAVMHALGKEDPKNSVLVCGAVAHIVPLLAESDIRQLMWEVDSAITSGKHDHYEWVDLMTVLRRVDRP